MPNIKKGMTLVEVILAMAILAIIVVFMTPVLVSAFRQIVIIGNRSVVSKSINGNIQKALAGGTLPGSIGSDVILLPSGETVLINKFEAQMTDALGNVIFNYFIPQGMTMATSPTSPTASTPTESSTSTTTSIPFGTTAPAPVAQFVFSAQTISVSVDAWRSGNKKGIVTLINSASWYNHLKYILTDKFTNTSTNGFLSGVTTLINLPENDHNYVLTIQNTDDENNDLTVNIGKAPIISKTSVSGNKFVLNRSCIVHSNFETITADMHHPDDVGSTNLFNYAYVSASDSNWSTINSTEIKSNEFPIYVHIINTNTISGLGILDTNSLPRLVTNP